MAPAYLKGPVVAPIFVRNADRCVGKHPFQSAATAYRQRPKEQKAYGPASIYRCRVCGFFHVGSDLQGDVAIKKRRAYNLVRTEIISDG